MDNCLIGKWDKLSLDKRQDLINFVQWAKCLGVTQYQQGSIALEGDHYLNSPRLWEYSMAILSIMEIYRKKKDSLYILDVGGANSLLGLYMWHLGHNVHCTDLLDTNVRGCLKNANIIDKSDSHINASKDNICDKSLGTHFDVVVSINVIEHVMEHTRKGFTPGESHYWVDNYEPSNEEWERERLFVQNCAKSVHPGGKLIISYDYKTQGIYKCQPKCAYMRSPQDVINRILFNTNGMTTGQFDWDSYDYQDFNPKASTGIIFMDKPE